MMVGPYGEDLPGPEATTPSEVDPGLVIATGVCASPRLVEKGVEKKLEGVDKGGAVLVDLDGVERLLNKGCNIGDWDWNLDCEERLIKRSSAS